MFLKCFWLLRKPSDQKNIFIDERFDYIWIFMSTSEDFSCTNLAKISLWSVWRDLREAKCVDLVVNYMKIFKFLWISTQFQKFLRRYGAFLRLKTLELRSGDTHKNSNVPQMLLAFEETVWSKKYFYWWTVRLHLNFMSTKNLKIFMHPSLAKISLWSVWRDLREAKCVDLVVNYMKIFKFLWISTQFQKFLRRYGAFLRLKTLELRSGDTHKNSNVPQMLLAFEETVWSKKYFYWWTVRLHLNFYVHKIWRFFITFCLAKISLWSVWRDLREAKCVDSGELYENLQIFVDLHSVSKVLRRYGAFLKD